MNRVDFLASHSHFLDHLAPVWKALPPEERGSFFIPASLNAYARVQEIPAASSTEMRESGHPICVASFRDLQDVCVRSPKRRVVMFEHGAGFTFGIENPSYAGGSGLRRHVSLFIVPNAYAEAANRKAFPEIPNVVVGCPKLDRWAERTPAPRSDPPVIAVSFHWDCHAAPETRSAFRYYRAILPALAKRYRLIGHGHPRAIDQLARFYRMYGIEMVRDFEEVMDRADLYINDCSSTLYEFASTGKPVVVLNCPLYRRQVHLGLRFWEHADVGLQCDRAGDLLDIVEAALQDPPEQQEKRAAAVAAAYPFRGDSAQRAVEAIRKYIPEAPEDIKTPVGSQPPAEIKLPVVPLEDLSAGIIYMVFGKKAAQGAVASIRSLRKQGCFLPVVVVGDTPVEGAHLIPWKGESPFDRKAKPNFQFRAGLVKPFLFEYSPFEKTLYMDSDTEAVGDIGPVFRILETWPMAVTKEILSITELYNVKGAAWYHHIAERDATIAVLGGTGEIPYWNSGVIAWQKCDAVGKVFAAWAKEWKQFAQWDEQLALMRAVFRNPLPVMVLAEGWNHPHREKARIIFHNYGRGTVRSNAH